MDNALVGFKKYNGKKSDLLNVTVEPGDIIFGIDSETDLPYIYHNKVFYSDASEWSEALPEIHIGKKMPPEKDPYIKLWLDSNANPPTLKYKNSVTNEWEAVSSNIDITETNEIFIGDNLPADISDNIKVWYQTNVNLPEEDIVVSWEDVENKPTFAEVAFSGSYTDLKDVPDTIKKTYYAHGQVDRSKYYLTDDQLIDNINTQKSIDNKEEANYIIHIVDTDKYYPASKALKNEWVKTLYAVVFDDDDNNIGNNIVNPIVTSVKLNIHNGEISEGKPIGGSGDAFVDSAYLSTKGYVNSHTTTYIGKENPSDLDSKYNLWVDTSNEEVVFKYKDAYNTWQILPTGGNGSIEVDTDLNATSENPIANKAVYELATVIGEDFETISKDLSKKASTENGLVEGRGFKVNDNLKYYLPNTTTTTDPTVDDTHIIATKADILSNEVIDSKATVYNLYAMDPLSEEQLEANAKALESVQNREVAIYKVYTNDDTYAIADVKLVPGLYLEAYVYVNNPDIKSKQATVTKYTYSFDQTGEYMTGTKQEVVVPSLSKVEEMIAQSGGGGSIAVDDALSFESTNPVQNKVIAENLDGIMYLDLELSALDANGLNSFYAKLSTLIDNSGRVKSFYCLYKGEVVKVDRLCMIGESTYVFVTKGVLQYVMVGTGLAELPWVFIGGMNNQLSYLGLRNLSAVCKDAVIEIDDIRYPVTSYEYGTSSITLYAIIKDHLNQYEVDGDGNMNLVSSEAIIGGGGTGGGLETRILYVPGLTAGSELTDEQKAYNAETCQKMLEKTAIAVIADDARVVYTDGIIDVAAFFGMDEAMGYIVTIKELGGVFLVEGDVMLTFPDLSLPIVIPDINSYDASAVITCLQFTLSPVTPTFYITKNGEANIPCSEVMVMSSGIGLIAEYYDENIKIRIIGMLTSQGSSEVIQEFPQVVVLGSADERNKKWMGTRHLAPCETPRLLYDGKSYLPISIARISDYVEFVICKDGTFETWRMTNDGSTTKL